MADQERYSAAWKQFLVGRRAILDEYDRALTHARSQPVQTHHGIVGEAAVRNWLTSFLPIRFGVTTGYIRSQGPRGRLSSHFDVIIYDALEAPILWIEENSDKSEEGRSRIIPAEHVLAVIEVKAAFNDASVTAAVAKLQGLAPFAAGVDEADARYPEYLPAQAVFGMLFMELRRADERDLAALESLVGLELGRSFMGGIILRGEGLHVDDCGEIKPTIAEQKMDGMFTDQGLLLTAVTPTKEIRGEHLGAMLMRADVHFSKYAFDLLAILKGKYDNRSSSFHGLDLAPRK